MVFGFTERPSYFFSDPRPRRGRHVLAPSDPSDPATLPTLGRRGHCPRGPGGRANFQRWARRRPLVNGSMKKVRDPLNSTEAEKIKVFTVQDRTGELRCGQRPAHIPLQK